MNEKPNILLITVDEMRKDALGCYGNEVIRTPNLDKLAQHGITFDKAYAVSPWCLPSRCSILTGLFPHKSGAYSNFRKCELDTTVPNFFNVLKAQSYETAMIGKCHFAPVPYDKARPDMTLPFEERDYYHSLGIDHLYVQDGNQVSVWFSDDYSKELEEAGFLAAYREAVWNKDTMKSFPFPGPAEWHPDSRVGTKAVEYIRDCNEQNSQCMWISFSGPHYPFDAPKEYYDRVDMNALRREKLSVLEGEHDSEDKIFHWAYHGGGPGIDGSKAAPGGACKNYTDEYWLEIRRNNYANISQIDDYIGQILEAAYNKFGENLLVVFTADHGELMGNHGLWGKNTCAYEDVLNVPLIVRYPNEDQFCRTDARVMTTNIFPTMLKAAKVKHIECDGIDFSVDIARGGAAYTFAEGEEFISISDGRYKYVQVRKNGKEFYEMFDMYKDPEEFINIVDKPEYQRDLAELRKAVTNHFIKTLLP